MHVIAPLASRDARLIRHCREGHRLARRDLDYRASVLARLRLDQDRPPVDLWTAIPWTWTASLGGEVEDGALAAVVRSAGRALGGWLEGDEELGVLEHSWRHAADEYLDLGSTLRSHPYVDALAWSLRTQFGG